MTAGLLGAYAHQSGLVFLGARGSRRVVAFLATLVMAASSTAQVAVTDVGTPSFSYPIAVPSGAAGMSPKIGLTYSGSGVNGPVGYGWAVQGISTITRCASNAAIDGPTARRAVTYTAADKLCLDGQRLIQTNASGTPTAFPQTNDSLGLSSGCREYRTEKDSFSRIRACGIAPNSDGSAGTTANGPAYFKVWTKAGQVFAYGNHPEADALTKALAYAEGKNLVMAWPVARISDLQGNAIDFKYLQEEYAWGSGPSGPTTGREWNVSEIQYSGNKVVFTYGSRTDDAEAYHQGSKNVSTRRLSSITTYVSATPVRTVKLNYQYGPRTGRLRVASISDCAGGSSSTRCLPPTSFEYLDGGDEKFVANASFTGDALATLPLQKATGDVGVLVADFNGDGRSDLLRWTDAAPGNKLYFSNGDGTFVAAPASGAAIPENLFVPGLSGPICYSSLVADFNGDGLPDVLRWSGLTALDGFPCASPPYGASRIYLNKGDGTFDVVTVSGATLGRNNPAQLLICGGVPSIDCQEGPFAGMTRGDTFYVLDVDGDGRADIVSAMLPARTTAAISPSICASTVCTRVFKGNGAGQFTEITTTNVANQLLFTPPDAGYVLGQPSHISDVDGDGLPDLVGISADGSSNANSWRSLGSGDFELVTVSGKCDYPIDFNGDGRADCLDAWSKTLSVSTGSTDTQSVANFNLGGETLASATTGVIVADINGDRRQDILRWSTTVGSNKVFLSDGGGTFSPSTTFDLTSSGKELWSADGTTRFVTGDFTGRGNVEILRTKTVGSTTTNRLYEKADKNPPDQLSAVISSSGARTELTYRSLSYPGSGSDARYLNDRGTANKAQFPLIDLQLPIYVVSTMKTDSGTASTGNADLATEFSYLGLKADLGGRGMLGFREVRRQTKAPNGGDLTTLTQYLQTYPYVGVAASSDTRLGTVNDTSATLLGRATYVYCDRTAAAGADANATVSAPCPTTAKVQRPYLLQSVEKAYDLTGTALPTTTTTNTFNDSGDPTVIAVTQSGGGTFTKTTTNVYQANDISGDNWILGRLTKATVASTVPNTLPTTSAGTGTFATAIAGTGVVQNATLSAVSFGSVAVNSSSTKTATLTSTGIAPLTIVVPTASSVTGTDFSFVSTTCTTTLAAGSTCTISVKFSPTQATARSGTLSVSTGAGALTAALTGTGSGSHIILATNNASALTAVKGGASATGTVTFKNTGNLAATLTMSGLTSPYSVSPTSCTAAANNGTCVVTVTMTTGGAVGSQGTQTLTATGGGDGVATASVSGTLTSNTTTITLTPASKDMGTVQGANGTSAIFTVTNTGSYSATIASAVSPTVTTGGRFSTSSTCGTLAASTSCTITVYFDGACDLAGTTTSNATLTVSGSNFTTKTSTLTVKTSAGICTLAQPAPSAQ